MSDTTTPKNSPEATNTAKPQVNEADLGEKLVREYLSAKLAPGKEGVAFYNNAKQDKCTGAIANFKEYYKDKKEWNDSGARKVIENMEKDYLYREFITTGAAFESKRKALFNTLDQEFNLPKWWAARLKKEIETLPLEKLEKYLKTRNVRAEFIQKSFQNETVIEHDMGKQFEKIFNGKKLSPKQEEAMAKIYLSSSVDEGDLDEALDLFKTLEEKQLIIKFFLPTISLGDLAERINLSDGQVREIIEQSIQQDFFDTDFKLSGSDLKDAIDRINPQDIIIPTYLFPESVVNAILSTQGRKVIAKAIEETNTPILKDFEEGNELGLTPDKDGKLLPSFIERLRKDFGLPHAEFFQEGNFIKGKSKDMDGKEHPFYLVIDEINDDPKINKETNGNGKFITVRNILTADGQSIDKNWKAKKGTGTPSSYYDLYALIKQWLEGEKWEKNGVELSTQAFMDEAIEKGELQEAILPENINNLTELNGALDKIDAAGAKYPIAQGSTIQVGKPEDDDFWVFTIKNINLHTRTIAISRDGKWEEIYNYSTFFDIFKNRKGARLPKMETPEEFLAALQNHNEKGKEFGDLIFDKDRGFIPKDQKDNKDFPSVTQFIGDRDTIFLHDGLDPAGSGWSMGEWEEEEEKNDKWEVVSRSGKYKDGAHKYSGHYNALFAHLLKAKAVPIIKPVPLKASGKAGKNMDMKSGFFKSYFGNPSLHSMYTGAKNLIDFVKNKLEHNSSLEAAKFQLALGKKLGFSDAVMRELRNKVYGNTRELMDKMVKDLSDMPAWERQKEVIHILENKGSHDYEVQAAVLAMLQKHGRLYVWALQKYEGSFIFFERITGVKYDPNSAVTRNVTKEAERRGIPLREEAMIQFHVHWLWSEKGWYGCDSGLWGKVRNSWEEGIKNEKEAWAKQAGQYNNAKQRLVVVKDKMKSGEVSQGVGAMEKVWSKGGSGPDMHLPAIYLILSGISNSLHTSQMDEFYNDFKTHAHTFPALAFFHSPDKVKLFQRVMDKLCERDPSMKKDYAVVKGYQKSNELDKNIDALETFWGKHGGKLHKKLVMSEDPEILFLAKTDEDFAGYVTHMTNFTDEQMRFNDAETGEGAYKYNHSSYVWHAKNYLLNLKINESSGVMSDTDKGTKMAWDTFKSAIGDVRNIHVSDNEEKNRAFQFERYAEYHKAFNTIVNKFWKDKVEKQEYMEDLKKFKFSVPLCKWVGSLDEEEYKNIVKADFANYIHNTWWTTEQTKATTATNVVDLISTARAQMGTADDGKLKKAA